jgi:hypothetical protein
MFILEVGIDPAKITEKMIDDFLENQGINRYTGRLADILKKNKDVEDKVSSMEKKDSEVRKLIMELKKASKR